MSDVISFSIIIGACLFFIALWIMKADSKRDVLKEEVIRLKNKAEAYERENIMLKERVESPAAAQGSSIGADSKGLQQSSGLLMQSMKQIEDLEKENRRLKSELDDAKGSLEEIYKAIVENK